MNKTQAIAEYGPEVVELARTMYETNFGKVFFDEDCKYHDDYSLDEQTQKDYLFRAKSFNCLRQNVYAIQSNSNS